MTRKSEAQIKTLQPIPGATPSPYSTLVSPGKHTDTATWEDVPASDLKLLICAVAANGHALMFSTTRNGGVSLSLYSQGEPIKMRMYDQEEVSDAIGSVQERALSLLDPALQERIGRMAAE